MICLGIWIPQTEELEVLALLLYLQMVKSDCTVYTPFRFCIANARHMSLWISISDQWHQDSNKFSSCCMPCLVLIRLRCLRIATTTEGTCGVLVPMKTRDFAFQACSIVLINVFIQRLNKSGDDGSPCSTPLSTLIGFVQILFTATVIKELL